MRDVRSAAEKSRKSAQSCEVAKVVENIWNIKQNQNQLKVVTQPKYSAAGLLEIQIAAFEGRNDSRAISPWPIGPRTLGPRT